MTTLAPPLLRNAVEVWESLYSSAVFSGIVGDEAHRRRGGYHISIEDQSSTTNYSVIRSDDKAPPGDWSRVHATAWDMSQNRDDMILSTRRWMAVWGDHSDPRRKYFNAFNGWTGSGDAKRWDFVSNSVNTSTNDHQWHFHGELRRRYWDDPVAHRALVSTARGDTKEQWLSGEDDMLSDQQITMPTEKLLTGEELPLPQVPSIPADQVLGWTLHHTFASRRSAEEGLKILWQLKAAAASDETRDVALRAAIQALADLVRSGGGDVDTAAILTRIDAKAAETQAMVEQRHQAEMSELQRDRQAEIDGLRAELARLEGPRSS